MLLRRKIRAYLLALAKQVSPLAEVVSDLKGCLTVSFPQAVMESPAAVKAWVESKLIGTANLLDPALVIWLVTIQERGQHSVKFTSQFMASEADNGKQAHSGHRSTAAAWIAQAQQEGVTLYPAASVTPVATTAPLATPAEQVAMVEAAFGPAATPVVTPAPAATPSRSRQGTARPAGQARARS